MYSPKIKEDLVSKLYKIGKITHKPMTRVVDEILRNYVNSTKVKQWKIPCPEDFVPHTNVTYTISPKKEYHKHYGDK